MKKEKKMFVVCLLLCTLMSSVAYGQTNVIKRQNTQKAPKVQTGYTPSNMKKGVYYMCIMESWNLSNSRAVCRKMAAKGYQPKLVQIPNEHDMGYFVCLKQTSNKAEAEKFAESFSDERYGLAYIFYNSDLLRYNKEKGVLERY